MNIFIDLETLPADPMVWRPDESKYKLGNLKDPVKIAAKKKELRQKQWEQTALDPLHGSIACIGAALDSGPVEVLGLDPDSDEPSEIQALRGLARFVDDVGRTSELVFVGHNAIDFDYKWLVRRAAKAGMNDLACEFVTRRWGDSRHLDTMLAWSGSKSLRDAVRLDNLARFFGLPSKGGLASQDVWKAIAMGDFQSVRERVAEDVEILRAVFRRMKLAGMFTEWRR